MNGSRKTSKPPWLWFLVAGGTGFLVPLVVHYSGSYEPIIHPTLKPEVRRGTGEGVHRRDAPAVADALASFHGHVLRTPGEKPIAGAIVEFRQIQASQGRRRLLSARSDRNGRVVIEGIPPGIFELRARAHERGKPHEVESLTVSTSNLERTIRLRVGPALHGHLVTWDRIPIRKASFALALEGGVVERWDTQLGPNGAFTLLITEARGPGTLQAHATGYPPSPRVDLSIGQEDIEGLRVVLGQGASVSGRVTNEQGGAVVKGRVRLEPMTMDQRVEVASLGQDGRFSFDEISPGEYGAFVEAEGYVVERQHESVRLKIGPNPHLLLMVRRGWRVTGRVLDPDRKGVGNASIRVTEASHQYQAATKQDGSFVIHGIVPNAKENQRAPGIDLLLCRAKGFGEVRRAGIAPDSDLTIVLFTGGSLEVGVILPSGMPPDSFPWSVGTLLGDSVNANSSNAGEPLKLKRATGPTCLIQDLQPGTYQVTVSALGYLNEIHKNITVVKSTTTRLDVLLTPGVEPQAIALIDGKDPKVFEEQLEYLLKHSKPEVVSALLDHLEKMRDALPESAETRGIIETLIKEYSSRDGK